MENRIDHFFAFSLKFIELITIERFTKGWQRKSSNELLKISLFLYKSVLFKFSPLIPRRPSNLYYLGKEDDNPRISKIWKISPKNSKSGKFVDYHILPTQNVNFAKISKIWIIIFGQSKISKISKMWIILFGRSKFSKIWMIIAQTTF